ncbi:hypothetical protein, partial [Haloferax sp. Atlit-12N]|uniref:hypothetical protein n=1 Tax=Haloferax sp. Atlit-12N TaxID=2077203 RepID=UPI001F1813A5
VGEGVLPEEYLIPACITATVTLVGSGVPIASAELPVASTITATRTPRECDACANTEALHE